jgi:hypothetical protein
MHFRDRDHRLPVHTSRSLYLRRIACASRMYPLNRPFASHGRYSTVVRCVMVLRRRRGSSVGLGGRGLVAASPVWPAQPAGPVSPGRDFLAGGKIMGTAAVILQELLCGVVPQRARMRSRRCSLCWSTARLSRRSRHRGGRATSCVPLAFRLVRSLTWLRIKDSRLAHWCDLRVPGSGDWICALIRGRRVARCRMCGR